MTDMFTYFNREYYTYSLPKEHIAQKPCIPPEKAKMLVYLDNTIHDSYIFCLPNFLPPQTILFFNDTKVMPARIYIQGRTCISTSGEKIVLDRGELFVYAIQDDYHFSALVWKRKYFHPGAIIIWDQNITLRSISTTNEGFIFQIEGMTIHDFLHTYGKMPLPPYITYSDEKASWYQTCFARYIGSVAAPTASLHFSSAILQTLAKQGYILEYATLHVGLSTFKSVYESDIRRHTMHAEYGMCDIYLFERIAQYVAHKQRILAVGTTMLRLLESLPYIWKYISMHVDLSFLHPKTHDFWNTCTADITINDLVFDIRYTPDDNKKLVFQTKIFIYPGFQFRVVDLLITNFHLPKSSLLILVAACIGDVRKTLYEHAIVQHYRFYSFGDAMLIPTPRFFTS